MTMTADWSPLGKDIFYRKIELYSMEWSDRIKLGDYQIAAAPFGGPIALIRDDKKLQILQGSAKPTILIFSCCGKLMSSIKWNSGKVHRLAWSNTENLLVIQEDGSVLVYDIWGVFQHMFSFGQEVQDTKVVDSKVFQISNATGIAVLTGSYRIFVISNIIESRIRLMPDVPGLDSPPNCWSVIIESKQPNILLAHDNRLFLLDYYKKQCSLMNFPVESSTTKTCSEISVSFNNRHVSIFSSDGIIWMGSADLQKTYCEFNTESRAKPNQLVWCGNGAVVGHWDCLVLVIGPEKDFINFSFDSAIHLVPELDSVRIISNYTQDLLQKVPTVVADILKIGSMSPGSMLLEASREFQKKSRRADDYIKMIKGQLEEAVAQCAKAASNEYNPQMQKMLLRAASFGKCFGMNSNTTLFVNTCRTLRVLNAIRDSLVGIPLTLTQMENLTIPVMIDRLVLRRQYPLAIRICQYLQISEIEGSSRILAHWACYKLTQTELSDDQLANQIAAKLSNATGISYADIANKAAESGRKHLATKLLDHEPRASEQVKLLMKLGQDLVAMSKAIDSGDTDLIYMVILHLKEKLSSADFYRSILSIPVAHKLYINYCKDVDKKLLSDLQTIEDDFISKANCRVAESLRAERVDDKLALLQEALEAYRKAKNDFAIVSTEEQIKLLKYQVKMEDKLGKSYYKGKSLQDTMRLLLIDGELQLANELKKEFKVPDKRFWWLRVLTLGETGDWTELETFSKSKKSPIGYEPFVDVCLKYNNKFEAQKYLPKIHNDNKVKYYMLTGLLEEAANIAFDQKDDEALAAILSKCGPTQLIVADKITSLRTRLAARK